MAVKEMEILAGPFSKFRTISLMNTPQSVKLLPGKIFEMLLTNSSTVGARFVKIYDKATSPIVASDVPVMTIYLEKSPNGQVNYFSDQGIDFTNGIWILCTNLVADTDNTAPTANDVIANIQFK